MILYFDTETTGLKPGHIIQLAYVLDYGDKITCKNFYFDVDYIEPSASCVHGVTVEKLRQLSKGKTFGDYIDEIDEDFSKANLIVAHNFKFDCNFMTAEFSYHNRNFNYTESLDTMRHFTPILQIPRPFGKGIKFPKLEEYCQALDVYPFETVNFVKRYFGESFARAHDATYDTAGMFLATKNACEKFPEFNRFLQKYVQQLT